MIIEDKDWVFYETVHVVLNRWELGETLQLSSQNDKN